MEFNVVDPISEDAQDEAFEIEAESYINAVEEALTFEEEQIDLLHLTQRQEIKELAEEEAVQASFAVSQARKLLNCRANDIIEEFSKDIEKRVDDEVSRNAEKYKKFIEEMLRLAIPIVNSEFLIICREEDNEYFSGYETENTLEAGEKGFILKEKDGKVLVDCTLRSRTAQVIHEKLPEISACLIFDFKLME